MILIKSLDPAANFQGTVRSEEYAELYYDCTCNQQNQNCGNSMGPMLPVPQQINNKKKKKMEKKTVSYNTLIFFNGQD